MQERSELYCALFNKTADILQQLALVQRQAEELYVELGYLTFLHDYEKKKANGLPPPEPSVPPDR